MQGTADHSENRLTPGEFWILSAAVHSWMPLGILTSPNLEAALNCPGHGLSEGEVADTVEGMFAARLICAHPDQGEIPLDATEQRAATCERNDRQAKQWYRTYYGLAPKGIEAWEAFARPDWTLFLKYGEDMESRRATVHCMNERLLREFCNAWQAWQGFEAESLAFDTVGSWPATYWKELPSGHRARFVSSDRMRQGMPLDMTAGQAVSNLYRKWCNRWP